ncbi:MAG TPA: hypothetical protein VJ890_11715 [Vineibacter sp.]|nr:hypothetical protein [Vineibacter sp.]
MIPTRLALGFGAGFFSHLIFQGALGAALYAAGLLPALPWSLMPVPPFGVPRSLNLAFWAGLWGLGYALLEPRLTARFGRLAGGLVYGLAPLAGYWFVALPLKGLGVGGGFVAARVPIEIAFHLVFGIGVAILFCVALAFARRWLGASQEAPRG